MLARGASLRSSGAVQSSSGVGRCLALTSPHAALSNYGGKASASKTTRWYSSNIRPRIATTSLPFKKQNTFNALVATRGLSGKAWAEGPSEPALLPHTIPQHFAEIVAKYGDRTAVISRHQGRRLTYKELNTESDILAEGLKGRGVRKGDRVCVMLGNSWEFAVLTYAVFKLGAILVPLNPAFTSTQVISAMSHLTASHLVISSMNKLPYKKPRSNRDVIASLVDDLQASPEKLSSQAVPCLKSIILVNNEAQGTSSDLTQSSALVPFSSLLHPSSASATSKTGKSIQVEGGSDPSDVINIQFTSGTTSSPKAACLTHRGVLNNGYFIGTRMGIGPGDVICCPPPLFHCFGCVLGYMACATTGATILFPDEAFNPEATLRAIQEEKATALYGVATMFIAELELLANGIVPYKGFEHLRTGIAAGSSVPASLMSRLHDKLNLTGLTICYGMTETSPVSCMTTPTDPIEKRINTVGKLMPHTLAKVVSPSDPTKILNVGDKGELVVAGYLVMKEYWDDAATTDEVLVRGARNPLDETDNREIKWMHTGDEAMIDQDGYVSITGRIKDLIIRGGENIHPLEIENCVFNCGGVREVSVVGLPDEKYGEGVAAFVVLKDGWRGEGEDGIWFEGAQQQGANAMEGGKGLKIGGQGGESKVLSKEMIREWVRGKMSGHLVPKWVFWTDEYPKTASGKIQKFRLREMGTEMLDGNNDHRKLSWEEFYESQHWGNIAEALQALRSMPAEESKGQFYGMPPDETVASLRPRKK